MKFVEFVGQFNFFALGKEEFVSLVEKEITQKKLNWPMTIATPNPEQMIQAWESPQFALSLKKFDYLLPDGVGLVWLKQTKPTRLSPIKQKIAGVEVVADLLLLAFEKNWRVLILGGKNYQGKSFKLGSKQFYIEILSQATNSQRLQPAKKPGQLLWTTGFEEFSNPSLTEEQSLVASLEKLRPEVVFVAFGAPNQENWIQANLPTLKTSGARLAMVVGGSFDILTGKLPRAPKLLRHLGLEWFWRLLLQPSRIVRQLRLIKFIWLSLFG